MSEKSDLIKQILCSKNTDSIKNPIFDNGYTIMTDGHILGMVSHTIIPMEKEFLPPFAPLTRMCEEAKKRKLPKEKQISFRPQDWMKLISTDLFEDSTKKIECEECEGEGGQDCSECDGFKECRECHAEGYKIVVDPDGVKTLPSLKYIFEINDKCIDASLIHKMLKSIKIIDPSNDYVYIYTKQHDPKIRAVGKNFIFIIMPLVRTHSAISLLKVGTENYD